MIQKRAGIDQKKRAAGARFISYNILMDQLTEITLWLAGAAVFIWAFHFRDPATFNSKGAPTPPLKPDPGAYTPRNIRQTMLAVISLAVTIGAVLLAGSSIISDKPDYRVITACFIVACAAMFGMMRHIDRIIGERTANIAASLQAAPITASSDYAACLSRNGVPLRFNLCTVTQKSREDGHSGLKTTVTAECPVANPGGHRLAIYRYFAMLPFCLPPARLPDEGWEPYGLHCTDPGCAPGLAAARDLLRKYSAEQNLTLEYVYMKGGSLKATMHFFVYYGENDDGYALSLARVEGALDITTRIAAAFN